MAESIEASVGASRRPAVSASGAGTLSSALRWKVMRFIGDACALLAAMWLARIFWAATGSVEYLNDAQVVVQSFAFFPIVILFTMYALGAYHTHLGLLRIETKKRLLAGLFVGVSLAVVLSFFGKFEPMPRLLTVAFVAIAILLLFSERTVLDIHQLRRQRSRGVPVLIYGAGETGRHIAQQLAYEPELGLRPVGFLDDDVERHGATVGIARGLGDETLRIVGSADHLERTVAETGAKVVFVAMASAPSRRVAELIEFVDDLGLQVCFVPGVASQSLSALVSTDLAGVPVLFAQENRRGRAYSLAERAFDVVGAGALLVLTAPVIALSVVVVRVTSRGPAILKQKRIGLNGRELEIRKLRTMWANTDRYAVNPTSERDPRITPAGRVLRRLSIDELPQLWNVFKGEMSLVGPRPEMPFIVEQYNELQRRRLDAKPGLTGLWQISGDRTLPIHENIHYDLYYIARRDLLLDVTILIMTPFSLLVSSRTF